jgi:hypothetical protein
LDGSEDLVEIEGCVLSLIMSGLWWCLVVMILSLDEDGGYGMIIMIVVVVVLLMKVRIIKVDDDEKVGCMVGFFDEYQGDSSEEDQGATPLCVVFCFLFFFFFLLFSKFLVKSFVW